MSWRDTLAKIVTGDRHAVVHEALPELQRAHAGLLQIAQQMRHHAELAPNQLSREQLLRLAEEDETQAKRVAEAIGALGGGTLPHAVPPVPAGALNHWARLVQDLELHRTATRHLREEAIHFAENLPETGSLFEQICAEEEIHAVQLRDLIARTDPQALD
jgi:bacterioferritin (cytochrome b1)